MDSRRRLTFDEWAALQEDEPGELVGGVLEEEETPSCIHELVVAFLIEGLRVWGRSSGALVLSSGVALKVAPARGRLADVVVYLRGAQRPSARGVVTAPPSIVIEVVSDTPRDERRDRVERLAEYAAFGVRWYWLVDPALRSFEVLELGADGRYAHAFAATEEAVVSVPGCDGLGIDVPATWSEVDALVAADGR